MNPFQDLDQFTYMAFPIPLILATFFLLVLPNVLRNLKPEKATPKLPPKLPGLPIIGNLHQLGKLPHQNLYQLSQKYGPTMLLQLGTIPTIVISSPEMAKQILKVHDSNFCTRPESPGPKKLTYNLLDIAFSPYNDHWKERRKILSFQLLNSKRSLPLWKSKRDDVTRKLIQSLSSEASKNKKINLDDKIFDVVGEIFTCVAFGKCYREYNFKGGCQELKGILSSVSNMLLSFSAEDYFPSILGQIIDTISGHRWRLNNCFAMLDDYFEMILQDHIYKHEVSKGDLHDDLVDVLVRLSKGPHIHLTSQHIKAMFLNIFLGGIDTTASTIVWAMTEIIRNQKVLKKLQDELRSIIGSKEKIDEEDVAKSKYLKLVVKETLRLHPVAPLLVPYKAMHDCKIEDGNDYYDISCKTRILVNVYAIARDPKMWKNPNEFYPERYEENEIDFRGAHFQLLPFGAGRRICPGMTVSMLIIEYIIAHLLYFFNWELPDGMKMEDVSLEEVAGITIHKKEPLCLKPIKYIYHIIRI